jgi:hypothetical protein
LSIVKIKACSFKNSSELFEKLLYYLTDIPLTQTSSIAVAGAVIGAVLALFIITVFVTVLLTPRKKRPSYLDKV